MDAISRAIVESANNESGATALHVVEMEDGFRSFITSGELARYKDDGWLKWSEAREAYVLTEAALQAMEEEGLA